MKAVVDDGGINGGINSDVDSDVHGGDDGEVIRLMTVV